MADGYLPIYIYQVGLHNQHSGPDFFNAKIKIGHTIWAGNIEIHLKSSDWNKHGHHKDAAYNNVILHVVYENDELILNAKAQPIPTLELKHCIHKYVLYNYQNILKSKGWIPCSQQINTVNKTTIKLWLDRLVYERLERKSSDIKTILVENNNDWENTFYQLLFTHFGLKTNALPFELLAKNTPLKIIEKHANPIQIEALLFGQAGFLNDHIQEAYCLKLVKEYQFLKNKFKLTPLNKSIWKFLRMRPANFPTIRISQLANLLSKTPRLFNAVIEATSCQEVANLFTSTASKYWDTHYQFGMESTHKQIKKIGASTLNNIMINVVVPMIFVYGKSINNEELTHKSIQWLSQLKPEKNAILSKWATLNIDIKNAMDTQALIELKNNYCSEKKCLNCSIGNKLLSTHGS